MRTLYWDLVGGAAGDMLMASLIDAGARVDPIRTALRGLGLYEVELRVEDAQSAGLRARRVDMMVDGELADADPEQWAPLTLSGRGGRRHRSWASIRTLLDEGPLSSRVRAGAQRTFRLLAEAEAAAHGTDVESVHFHEVGAADAIADVVGVAVALEDLGIERIMASPAPTGRGLIRGAHGPIPLPAPATLHLLTGVPSEGAGLEGEPVTPTGAALLRAHVETFGPMPSLRIEAVGTGCGHRSWPDRPNVVRAILGEVEAERAVRQEGLRQFEANMDDMSPQDVPVLVDALLEAGAADAWSHHLLMKKGRPAVVVGCLARESQAAALEALLFRHGTTLGLRSWAVERRMLARRVESVQTPFGEIRIKRAERPGGSSFAPEFEDCQAAARAHGVSVREVREAALAIALRKTQLDP
ncbi:MAG: nickel pincer cofactor biosynthesis protein LarC [Myxococcota bacterium]